MTDEEAMGTAREEFSERMGVFTRGEPDARTAFDAGFRAGLAHRDKVLTEVRAFLDHVAGYRYPPTWDPNEIIADYETRASRLLAILDASGKGEGDV